MTGPRSARVGWIIAILPLTTVVSHSFGRSTYPLLLPVIRDDILASNTEAGFGGTAVFVAYLLGVIAVTAVASRLEPITIMRSGLALAVLGLGTLASATNLVLLILGLALTSVAGAGIWITAPVLITAGVPAGRRGLVIGLLSSSIGLASAAVAGGTRLAWDRLGDPTLWRPVYAVEAAIALAVLVAVLLVVRPQVSNRPGAESERSDRSGSGFAPAVLRGLRASFRIEALRRVPSWRRLTSAYVCFGFIGAGFVSFLAASLEEDAGLSRGTVALVFMGMGLGSVAGAPFTGWLSDFWGRRIAMAAVMAVMAGGSLCVALLQGPVLVVVVVAFGGLWASYPTLTATFVRDHLDQREFSAAFGIMTVAYGVAAVLPPLLVGVVADRFGTFRGVYLALAVIAVLGCLLALGIEEPSTSSGG